MSKAIAAAVDISPSRQQARLSPVVASWESVPTNAFATLYDFSQCGGLCSSTWITQAQHYDPAHLGIFFSNSDWLVKARPCTHPAHNSQSLSSQVTEHTLVGILLVLIERISGLLASTAFRFCPKKGTVANA